MSKRRSLEPGLAGVAGEYFVAGELSRRGYVATLTLRNTRGIDVLVSNADATKHVGIQVKTHQDDARDWILTSKIEKQELAANLFFVFVRLNNGGEPGYHIVPCEDVVRYATESHLEWLETPGRDGRAHQDSPVRKFRDREDRYLDRWDLLGLD